MMCGKRLFKYRKAKKLCLNCGTSITPEISKRRFCLICGLEHFKIIRFLNRLNKNLKTWRRIR